MRSSAAFALIASAVAADHGFESFKKAFQKSYSSPVEEAHRRGIYEMNVELIETENAKGLDYKLGVNQFSDLLESEWSSQFFGIASKPAKPYGGAPNLGRHTWNGEALPSSVDWTQKGAVTPVKNQAQCGSCWAFSTTGSLEGANFISSGKLVSLSEQQFVDCDAVDNGCQGGLMDNAFKYAEKNAICTEESYPYRAAKSTCQAQSCTSGLKSGSVTGYKDVGSTEQDLMAAVAQQPVSIAIEADKAVFQSYKSGVLSGLCGASLDHGVLVVGYGTDPVGGDYWKVKNSWGPSWGEEGFVLLKRGKGGTGECGILSQPSYPVITTASAWEDFKKTFNKVYTSSADEARRRGIFEMNVEFIQEENAKGLGYSLGVNQFSDLLLKEWSGQYFGIASKPALPYGAAPNLGVHKWKGEALPPSVDWTEKGAVTPVKNQGQCGSCWSFSSTGSLEGANFVANGKLVSLSEQQFVDCDTVDSGCQGGLMDNAFKYAEKNAICTEESYPYKAAKTTCQAQSCSSGLESGAVTGYKDVGSTEQDLMAALAQQPVSIAIEADKAIFQSYKSGVLSGMCGASLDHGVLVVGYGTDPTYGDYWKVKNSWGETWGKDGYVLLKRGKGGTGECGLLKQPSYPQVSSARNIVV